MKTCTSQIIDKAGILVAIVVSFFTIKGALQHNPNDVFGWIIFGSLVLWLLISLLLMWLASDREGDFYEEPRLVHIRSANPGECIFLKIGKRYKLGRYLEWEKGEIDGSTVPFATVHCCQESGDWVLMNNGSPEGTVISGRVLAPGEAYPLANGDEITVGNMAFRFLLW